MLNTEHKLTLDGVPRAYDEVLETLPLYEDNVIVWNAEMF